MEGVNPAGSFLSEFLEDSASKLLVEDCAKGRGVGRDVSATTASGDGVGVKFKSHGVYGKIG